MQATWSGRCANSGHGGPHRRRGGPQPVARCGRRTEGSRCWSTLSRRRCLPSSRRRSPAAAAPPSASIRCRCWPTSSCRKTPTWCRRAGTRGRRAAAAGAAGSDACGEPPHPEGGEQRHPLRPEVYVRSIYRLVRQARYRRPCAAAGCAPAAADGAGPGRCLCRDGRAPAGRRRAQSRHRPRRARAAGGAGPRHPAHHPRTAQAGGNARRAWARPRPFPEASSPTPCPRRWKWCRTCARSTSCCCSCASGRPPCPARARQHGGLPRGAAAEARRPAQALGLEVVHLMIDHPGRRPAPAAGGARHRARPRTAAAAPGPGGPRFFSDRSHPARQLLEQVTQRSLAWSSADDPGFATFMEGPGSHRGAARRGGSGPETYEIALSALEAWDEAQPRLRRNRERAVRALMRRSSATCWPSGWRGRCWNGRTPRCPPEALAFLTGPWAQVMAQARLADNTGAEDPGATAGSCRRCCGACSPRSPPVSWASSARWWSASTRAWPASTTCPPTPTAGRTCCRRCATCAVRGHGQCRATPRPRALAGQGQYLAGAAGDARDGLRRRLGIAVGAPSSPARCRR